MDWLPDVASATPGIAHQQAALAVSGASLLVSLMGFGPANVTLALTYVARHVTVWAVIETFRHKGLRELHETGQSAKVDSKLIQRCTDVLDALEAANNLKDLNLPGFSLHPLKGKPVRHSIHVNGPWCVTFEWDAPRALRVDLEQYHSKLELLTMAQEFVVQRDKITRAPVHPGVFFERNILPEFRRQRRTIGEIARLLDVSRQTLYRVMTGQAAVTPDMAARLGKLCGNGPELWLNLQARHDAWEVTHRLADDLKRIPTLREEQAITARTFKREKNLDRF